MLTQRRPLIIRLGKWARPWFNRMISSSSILADTPVFEERAFLWTEPLRAHWQEIREELDEILLQRSAVPRLDEISPDHARIATGGKWQSFFLYGYGFRFDENCRSAPRTADLVAGIPGLNSAFFSILAPGCHIPRHKGVTNALLTCHLGLRVPEPNNAVRMMVDEQLVYWSDGQCLVFDDSRHHEVWNETKETRVVLLIQFRRPIRVLGRLLFGAFLFGIRHSAFVQDARRNVKRWDETMRTLEKA